MNRVDADVHENLSTLSLDITVRIQIDKDSLMQMDLNIIKNLQQCLKLELPAHTLLDILSTAFEALEENRKL